AAVGRRPVAANGDARGPGRGRPRNGGFALRVDAALKERLVVGIEPGDAEPALEQRVDGERRQMALVEADRVAQRDRPGLVRLGADVVEERRRALAVAKVPGGGRLAVEVHW